MSGEADVGSAMRTDVRVVERGIEALRRERRAVWRRCGRMVRVWIAFVSLKCVCVACAD
jgi:hypothetical protein